MKTKKNYEVRNTKYAKKEFLINGGDLDLYLDLFLTDENGNKEHILTKKADSIVANFLRILYLQMGRDMSSSLGTFYSREITINNINSITSGTAGVYRINLNSSYLLNIASGKICLGGLQGIAIDGLYDFTRVDNSTLELTGTTYTSGWDGTSGGVIIFTPKTSFQEPSYQSFKNSGIVVGTGTTAVNINDYSLIKQVPSRSVNGGLVYNTSTVSQDTNDATSAQITFTRTFSNQAALTIAVTEVGLFMDVDYSSYKKELLVMRDLVPGGVNVANGKTLTVNYRLKTILGTGTDPGGFLSSFMRMMYRHAANSQRAIFDINNISRTYGSQPSSFLSVKNGGKCIEYPGQEVEEGYKYGLLFGTGNTAVSMADYFIETLIAHGISTNQMLYYGGFIENFVIGADYAQFSIYKAAENKSGSTIQVKEYAIISGAGNSSGGTNGIGKQAAYLYTMTHNILSTPVDVLNTEAFVMECIIKVTV